MKFLLSLFLTFLKIGVTTFGGGYAMIANFHETIVEKKKWLDEEEFLEIITVAESTPGPIAINVATYVGFKKKGFFALGKLRNSVKEDGKRSDVVFPKLAKSSAQDQDPCPFIRQRQQYRLTAHRPALSAPSCTAVGNVALRRP